MDFMKATESERYSLLSNFINQPNKERRDTMSKVNENIFNLFSTVRIDGAEIRKSFVTVVYPPESFAGFGIPKVILTDKKLSEQEIDQNLEEMARQNTRWLFKQAEGKEPNAD